MNYRKFSHENMNFMSVSAITVIVATVKHNGPPLDRKRFVTLLKKFTLYFNFFLV